MRAMGAPEDVIAAKEREWAAKLPPPDLVEVYPENVQAFWVFWTVRSQWELPGSGRCTVPFSDVEAAMRARRVTERRWTDCFERVAVMLLAARQVLIERHNKDVEARRMKRGR